MSNYALHELALSEPNHEAVAEEIARLRSLLLGETQRMYHETSATVGAAAKLSYAARSARAMIRSASPHAGTPAVGASAEDTRRMRVIR